MIDVSSELMLSLETFGDEKSLSIDVGFADITSDLISQGTVKIKQGLGSKDNYSIGNTICAELDFSVINNKNKYSENSFYNKEAKVKLNIVRNDGVKLSLNCGKFTCQRPVITNSGKINVTAYDDMIKFEINSDAFLNTLEYPVNILTFMRAACDYCGVSHNISDDVVNADFMIQERPNSQKYTIRKLMNMAVEILGGNGQINLSTGNFEIVYLVDSGYEIPDSVHFTTVNIEDIELKKITCTVASNKENNDVIYGDQSGYVYYLDGNELLYGSTDEDIVNVLGYVCIELQKFYDYKPFKLEIQRGLVFLQPGDVVSFNYNDVTYKVPILDRELNGVFLGDSLSASGSEDRAVLRQYDSGVTAGQVEGMANSAASAYSSLYSLTATKRYIDTDGNITAMGMIHGGIEKELIFIPQLSGNSYTGMKTNFGLYIPNTDVLGDPDEEYVDFGTGGDVESSGDGSVTVTGIIGSLTASQSKAIHAARSAMLAMVLAIKQQQPALYQAGLNGASGNPWYTNQLSGQCPSLSVTVDGSVVPFKVRPDCSGLMSVTLLILGAPVVECYNTSGIEKYASTFADTGLFQKLQYSRGILQPGDIMVRAGHHTEMFYRAVGDGLQHYSWGSTKSVQQSFNVSTEDLYDYDDLQVGSWQSYNIILRYIGA